MGAAGFLANLLREARSKRKYAIMRDCPVYNLALPSILTTHNSIY
jgi:hypothetical protein